MGMSEKHGLTPEHFAAERLVEAAKAEARKIVDDARPMTATERLEEEAKPRTLMLLAYAMAHALAEECEDAIQMIPRGVQIAADQMFQLAVMLVRLRKEG